MTRTIGYIVGSISSTSINRRLARVLANLAPEGTELVEIPIKDLPFYSPDYDGDFPQVALDYKKAIADVDGVVIVTPEYSRSIPGVLKNAIDHASRPYGQSVWGGKPAGVLGASIGSIGTALAQQHLRNVLAYLDVPTMGQPEAFIHAKDDLIDVDGGIGPASKQFLQTWMDTYVEWVKNHVR